MSNNQPHPKPFLQIVAEHYYHQSANLTDYCFVFPNRRSGQFFLNYLKQQAAGKLLVTPQVTTITDFEAEVTHQVTATPTQAIFALYHAYQKVVADQGGVPEGFDKFLFWGNIILSDFNDVDNYMVDAQQLFKNTSELHEISTDYLTPELKTALNRYFSSHFDDQKPDGVDDHFWNHTAADGEAKKRYLSMWNLLYPIYLEFSAILEQQGLTTAGKMARDAAQTIKEIGPDDLNAGHYVMVGFSTLSTAEMAIFTQLQKKGIAQFCWDYFAPAFSEKANKGCDFLDILLSSFHNAITTQEAQITGWPTDIHVIGIPSQVGQAKYAFTIVDKLVHQGKIANPGNAIDTAIVLPDEKLFTPLINSVASVDGHQSAVQGINVTLGYQLRQSSIVGLMHIVAKMHSQATRRPVPGGGYEFCFLKENVITVLSHPIIKSLFAQQSTQLLTTIDNNTDWNFNVPQSAFKGYDFIPLFSTIERTNDLACDCSQAIAYLDCLQQFALTVRGLMLPGGPVYDELDAPIPLQVAFIDQYVDALAGLSDLLRHETGGIALSQMSVFYLLDRLSSMGTIPFEGEPLAGLQIMGMLETRCLDFSNLIMLSVNERVYPRKFFSSSFIPMNVRRAFCMSTTDHQESMVAYYFYRLLGRAQNVYLLYDTNTKGIGSGEYSRFVSQLDKVYGLTIHFHQVQFTVKPSAPLAIEVPKSHDVNDFIANYLDSASKQSLSASSIKELLKCPLLFYLHHIQGLNTDDDNDEFMPPSTFGTIVHDVLQQFYYPNGQQGPHKIFKNDILQFIKSGLEGEIVKNVNKTYLHLPASQLAQKLTGETEITYEGMRIYLLNELLHDKELIPGDNDYIEVIECETPYVVPLDLGYGCPPFNFDFRIDRVDRVVTGGKPGSLRIIDYKTGRDETKFSQVDDLVNPTSKDKDHLAIMQILLYCNAYAKAKAIPDEPIQPIIYSLRNMSDAVIKFGSGKKVSALTDYHTCNDAFRQALASKLFEFFDQSTPLRQCPADAAKPACNYCKFIDLCRRVPKAKY